MNNAIRFTMTDSKHWGAEDIATVFSGRQRIPAQLDEDQHIADAMVELLADLATANPDVPMHMLDQTAVEVGACPLNNAMHACVLA